MYVFKKIYNHNHNYNKCQNKTKRNRDGRRQTSNGCWRPEQYKAPVNFVVMANNDAMSKTMALHNIHVLRNDGGR